jgi:hypothetical protein
MTRRHIYFGIENLNLSAEQRGALVEVLRALGPAHSGQPCRLCHWRTRLDNEAAIYEALFDEDTITVQAFKSRLGNIFDVSPSTIDHSTNQVTLDSRQTAVVTFSRNETDYLRVAFFGYAGDEDWPTWEESRVEAVAYLAANEEEWEGEV